jgi:hypothetical protein
LEHFALFNVGMKGTARRQESRVREQTPPLMHTTSKAQNSEGLAGQHD